MANPLAIAAAIYGGYRGLRDSRRAGASGINQLLSTAAGAFGGFNLGNMIPGFNPATAVATKQAMSGFGDTGFATQTMADFAKSQGGTGPEKRSILDLLLKRKEDTDKYDPFKISALAGGIPFALGAFNQGPTDIYQPGYNLAYATLAQQRPGYTYIDPTTGQEVKYEKVYIPEADPKNQGDFRVGPYGMNRTQLKVGGLAEIKKFNEGGINYLPSKMTHDENDANNYVRASGYVEDGAGVGDKDEDTMLAQLADGEFVTRADGVLGAGIIAGANPNSMKDMREKGAKYFYEQQARYKRVFDLLKEKNGSNQKTN